MNRYTKQYVREAAEARRAAGLSGRGALQADRDARRLMETIPPDTRTITGRMLGDPLPGRSALDMRASA